MSKLLIVCKRDDKDFKSEKIKEICDSLNPDNINPNLTEVLNLKQTKLGISNPLSNLKLSENGIVLGKLFGEEKNWDQINGSHPDGNYVIVRWNHSNLELLSDILGTRALWYYFDEQHFIASTSQKAIVQYLGDFQFNESVIPWVLCNGLLGPGHSWDKRFKLLDLNAILNLDKELWKITIHKEDIHFKPNQLSDSENINQLEKKLKETLKDIEFDYKEWYLTLSGGYDSRGILGYLNRYDSRGNQLKSITWGLKDRVKEKGNDAYVANKLAQQEEISHTYFATDSTLGDFEKNFERFLENGEGRIDHLGGYMDGFNIWSTLFENKISGVIRGDEVFGSYNFISDYHLKKFMGLTLPSDYTNLKELSYLNDFSEKLPKEYEKLPYESEAVWRDRLYQSYLVPIFLSALTDLKSSYVEQVNPLLSKRLIYFIREMPDHLRTEKKAFKKIVKSLNFQVPFAKKPAIDSIQNIFREKEVLVLLNKELSSNFAKTIFPDSFLNEMLLKINKKNKTDSKKSFLTLIKNFVPKKIKKIILKETFNSTLDYNLLAFRIFLICRMVKLLQKSTKDEY